MTLTLTAADEEAPTPVQNPYILEGPGEALFTIGYQLAEADNTYTYTVTESADGFNDAWSNDGPVTVTVAVTDNGEGKLEFAYTYDKQNVITNTYYAEGRIQFKAVKTMTTDPWPEGADTFTFILEGDLAGDDGMTADATEDAPEAAFDVLTITNEDLSGDPITFTVKEVFPEGAEEKEIGTKTYMVKDHIAYTTDSYVFEVTPSDDGEGTISFSVKINGEEAGEDTCVTETDENDDPVLVCSTGEFLNGEYYEGSVMLAVGKDFADGKEWPSGTPEFTFELLPADDVTIGRFGEDPFTAPASIDDDPQGTALFDTFLFLTDDRNQTYTFELTESIPADAVDNRKDGVTYDTETYTVVIGLSDDLTPTVTLDDGTVIDPDINRYDLWTFVNRYDIDPLPLTFSGKKRLIGMSMTADQYSFTMTHPDGTAETVSNDANGLFAFEEILFEEPGTYTYTVIEEDTNVKGVKYDNTVYNIIVTMEDNGKGGLEPGFEGVPAEDQIIFINRISNSGSNPPSTPAETVLPRTGFSARHAVALPEQPKALNYRPLLWHLEIPTLSVSSEIVEVPSVDGEYAVTWLGNDAGLLAGSALPGEGRVLLTGHNHLNTMEAGPFALLDTLETGDRLFVTDPDGNLQIFEVYMNTKIAESDFTGLWHISETNDKSMTLITCEDERPDGSYENRRIVAAKPIK